MAKIAWMLLTAALFLLSGNNVQAQVTGNCGLVLGGPVTFCDTFDNKNPGIVGRTGDLDPNVWGVSRATGNVNFGQGQYNMWAATQLVFCNGTSTVKPPADVIICNGQLREASNDNVDGGFEAGTVTTLAMYPKQPFDFAGRTGVISFDVSNDTHSIHAAWPELWVTDLPIPTPFVHSESWESIPANGFGVRMAAGAGPQNLGMCNNNNNINVRRWTVDSAVVIRNYVVEDTSGVGVSTGLAVQALDCVIASPGPGGPLNHVEFKINQNQIDVYATDAGVTPTVTTLKHIAVITNANLTLTRGLVWIEDVHYNADKGDAPSQRQHTFTWDNVAFDGPFTYRDFSYDAPDNNAPGNNGSVNLGKFSDANKTSSWTIAGLPANPSAQAARVLFNFYNQNDTPSALNVTVNGHAHSVPWPFPDQLTNSWRTYAVTIPLTDLVAGTNTVLLGGNQAQATANVNLVLVNVAGGVPVLPGSINTFPTGGTTPPVAVNGVCGSSNGATLTSAPTANLCSVGVASTVGGTGPWTWSCTGTNGGLNAACSAQLAAVPPPVSGLCGSANGVAVASKPTSNLCSSGAASTVTGTGPWSWSCIGSNGGNTIGCSAPLLAPTAINGACGAANGTATGTMPAANLCSAGTVSGPWAWSGGGLLGGTIAGPWSWVCVGSSGGTNASCSAAHF